MKIKGQILANQIQNELKNKISLLQKKGVTPTLAIVTVGNEGSWKVYVGRKVNLAKNMGIQTQVINMQGKNINEIEDLIQKLNNDKAIHGIIIQRPIPENLSEEKIVKLISPQKDVDAFRADSSFKSPVFQGVSEVLNYIYKQPLKDALRSKNVVVLGKGTTAGGPTSEGFKKAGITPTVIDSKTENREELLKNADVIISAVGKKILHAKDIKDGAVIIGIGTHVERGTLLGDFDEDEISSKASYYTPTPGGIGPLNVSFLFSNLLKAAE